MWVDPNSRWYKRTRSRSSCPPRPDGSDAGLLGRALGHSQSGRQTSRPLAACHSELGRDKLGLGLSE